MDVVSSEVRSRMMASIRGGNTKPERVLRSILHALGFRFRIHRKDLPGRPDIVLPKHKLAILVHGCFWHRHTGCRYAYNPKSNKMFWQQKFRSNVVRDRRVLSDLHANGWRTLVIWECDLRSASRVAILIKRLARAVRSKVKHAEIPRRATNV